MTGRLLRVAMALVVLAACGTGTTRTKLVDLMAPGRVLVVGELHGTKQMPAAVSRAIEDAVDRDLTVHVGLEISEDEGAALASYLDSDGQKKDRARLLRSAFWKSDDGRASEAMLKLVEHARSLHEAGGDVELLPFDVPHDFNAATAAASRDRVMALFIADAVKSDPKDAFIVLVGNFHASRAVATTEEDPRYEPMARWLADDVPDMFTLLGTHAGGTAWNCAGEPGECGVHRVVGDDQKGRPPFVLLGGANEGFDGSLFVGNVTASRPARSTP